jgi:dihydropteroate synthase
MPDPNNQLNQMKQRTLNCRGRLLDLSGPVVMGILNLTPDSFYDGGRHVTLDAALLQAEKMLREGAAILDVGGASTRPGAVMLSTEEEKARVIPVIEAILRQFPEALISVDTYQAAVARAAVAAGAVVLNDVSFGGLDPELLPVLGDLNTQTSVPYVLMHMQGKPDTMQQQPVYEDVVSEVLQFFVRGIARLRTLGVRDIILDPGFGFGKTVEHNFQLLQNLHVFSAVTGLPVLAGLSRKSMICKTLHVRPENALNGTTALHMVALQQGASILRVHDVREAVQTIRLWEMLTY